ncbi:guanine deaminase [Xylariaceae sp. FL1019]|nr:guanine deaminase [Xylariaceae sp. FL1019]
MVKIKTAQEAQTGASDPILTRIVEEDKVKWYRKPNLRTLYLLLFPTCMGIELTSGFDSQLINALQIVPAWIEFFDDPDGALKGIIAAAYSLGAILSLPFIGIVNDKFGRRWSIFGGSAIMVIGALIQGLSVNVAQYIIARLILGFGIPTCIVSASSLIGELSYPKERPVLTSLFNVSYFVGQLAAAGITFGTNNILSNYSWRIPSWLQMVPSLFQIAFVFFIPESPRWLITKDRSDEAFDILAKYHAEGDRESEFVKAEFAQLQTTIEIELTHSKRSWKDLFSTSGMRRRVLISTMLGLFTQVIISYYLGDILQMIGHESSVFKQKINVATAANSLIWGTVAASVVTRFRRRAMFLTCTVGLLFIYIGWTISMKYAIDAKNAGVANAAAGGVVLFFIFAYSPVYNIGYNALTYTYMVELWPYAERSRGIAFFQLWGRLASFFTTFVNPIGLDNASWRYLISYVVFLAYEILFVYFMFPETFGRTLEELAFLFEDKALADEAVHAVEKVVGHHEEGGTERKTESSHTLNSLISLDQNVQQPAHVFHGTIIHSLGLNDLEIIEDGLLIVTPDGIINQVTRSVPKNSVEEHLTALKKLNLQYRVTYLARDEFLIPGFVDTHNHAPQWAMRGLGQSMHILDWLSEVTFPNEAKFADEEYARRVYDNAIEGFLQQGITTASYYSSMHAGATKILAELCLEKGQRALVGKCNMSRNAPDYYRDESIEASLRDTKECIEYVRTLDPRGTFVNYVITPRFAITCEDELLVGLGEMAKQHSDLMIQTHFNEAEQEMVFTKTLFPGFENEVDLYEHFGLLTKRSILAHCCFMTEYELEKFQAVDCGVAHCPVSNMTVGGGFMAAPVREFLRRGIKVGLGTDSGGGFSSSILDAMRQALVASNSREVTSKGADKGLSIKELFHLATLGGAQVCCLDDKIGNFVVGKEFDALVIGRSLHKGVMTLVEDEDSAQTIFEKFIMTGDDRNIRQVFVRGRSVK